MEKGWKKEEQLAAQRLAERSTPLAPVTLQAWQVLTASLVTVFLRETSLRSKRGSGKQPLFAHVPYIDWIIVYHAFCHRLFSWIQVSSSLGQCISLYMLFHLIGSRTCFFAQNFGLSSVVTKDQGEIATKTTVAGREARLTVPDEISESTGFSDIQYLPIFKSNFPYWLHEQSVP